MNNSETDLNDLIISCEPTLCMKWLIPRLKGFNDQGNPFKIKILTDDGSLDFSHVDIAIRRDDFLWKEHIYSIKLMNEIMFFIQNSSQVGENILVSSSRPKFWGSLLKINSIRDKITHLNYKELDQFYLCIEACLSGLGATFASGYMIENELKSQKLEPIIEPFHDGSAYYLLSASPIEEDYRKVVFKNWLFEQLNQTKKYLEEYSQVKK